MAIIGAHTILYSKDADADRAFLRDVLGFDSVDAGGGWLIFALPPSEAAIHPSEENDKHELYLLTDNVDAEIATLTKAGVACDAVDERRYGRVTTITLPGGGRLGLYQPHHPLAHG